MVQIHEGETHFGRQREPGPYSGPYLEFEIASEIEQLQREPAYHEGRNAKTLVKFPDMRVVLTAIKGGHRIDEHHAMGRISVQVLRGHIRMRTAAKTFDLPAGRLLSLEREMRHDVEALEDSVFLLTIAWPEGSKEH